MRFLIWMLMLLGAAITASHAESKCQNFIRVKGDQLFDGDKPFRFVSWNIPNLHLMEDNLAWSAESPWRWPDRYEINDALESVKQFGGTVVRTYVLSVARENDPPGVPRHVLGPGKFNEEGFRALDEVLAAANQKGIRVIVPFVDNWNWWGGIEQYAGFRGKAKNEFWTDPQIIADFKVTIAHLVNRRNTITGVLYRDDKAILCWETGNELESPPSWTKNIAAYIKSLDPVHPVMDGYYATGMLREESLTMPEVDIVSTHHYPNVSKDFAWLVRANAEKAKGRKPYIVGEFGFLPTSQMLECVNTVKQTGVCGAMLWSLRPHNRDGGFYWHSEPTGGDKYKAFHWPGSPCGEDYDEMSLMQKMRKLAFEIRGLPVPEVAVPGAPTLLPFDDPGGISWQGSAGAESYDVERASTKRGPWVKAGVGVDESLTQYRPQFSDETATQGRWFYRVRAGNVAGLSKPSNVVGPINVKHVTLVDEMSDFSRLYACAGDLQIVSRDCRAAREDAHRVVGQEGTELVYQVSGKIINMRVFVFFPGEIADLKFGLSKDGKSFRMAAAPRNDFKEAKGDYHYMGSAIYTLDEVGADDHFVKISFAGEAQISRIEIQQLANKR